MAELSKLRWVRKAREFVRALNAYAACFGITRGILLILLVRLFPHFDGRLVKVPIPGSAAHVCVRLGSTDVAVFVKTLLHDEYSLQFAAPPAVIVDAGAYTGLSAVYFATRHPRARIIAVEPSPSNFELLVRNTAAFPTITPVQAALWSDTGSLVLKDPGEGAWSFRVGEPQDLTQGTGTITDDAGQIELRAITLVDLMKTCGLEKIDLLKVDIEGSEIEVFANSDSWIHNVGAIFVELHDRFRPGCSRTFFKAVADFPVELWNGETVMVARTPGAKQDASRVR